MARSSPSARPSRLLSAAAAAETGETDMADKPRIKLPKEAKQGEIIQIKTLVSHLMESGQRKDAQGKPIPRKIINKFTCEFNGKPVFACTLEPAISANPYIQF